MKFFIYNDVSPARREDGAMPEALVRGKWVKIKSPEDWDYNSEEITKNEFDDLMSKLKKKAA